MNRFSPTDSRVDGHSAHRLAGGVDPGKTPSRSSVARKIQETVGYMLAHLDQPLQVAHLAAMANVSPSHYFALFKQQTGCSPISFFTRLRMRRARGLLQDSSLSVKEVAAALGYDDPFYFSRVFKSVHKVAPTEYRLRLPRAGGADWNTAVPRRPAPVNGWTRAETPAQVLHPA